MNEQIFLQPTFTRLDFDVQKVECVAWDWNNYSVNSAPHSILSSLSFVELHEWRRRSKHGINRNNSTKFLLQSRVEVGSSHLIRFSPEKSRRHEIPRRLSQFTRMTIEWSGNAKTTNFNDKMWLREILSTTRGGRSISSHQAILVGASEDWRATMALDEMRDDNRGSRPGYINKSFVSWSLLFSVL